MSRQSFLARKADHALTGLLLQYVLMESDLYEGDEARYLSTDKEDDDDRYWV